MLSRTTRLGMLLRVSNEAQLARQWGQPTCEGTQLALKARQAVAADSDSKGRIQQRAGTNLREHASARHWRGTVLLYRPPCKQVRRRRVQRESLYPDHRRSVDQ